MERRVRWREPRVRWPRHRAGHVAVLLLALVLLIDAATPLLPGAFRLPARGSLEVASAPSNGGSPAGTNLLRTTPRPVRSTVVDASGPRASLPSPRLAPSPHPAAPRIAYLSEPGPARPPDDD